jgi:hypothetical protein
VKIAVDCERKPLKWRENQLNSIECSISRLFVVLVSRVAVETWLEIDSIFIDFRDSVCSRLKCFDEAEKTECLEQSHGGFPD